MENLTENPLMETADLIRIINEACKKLDISYLTKALEDMKDNHSTRDAAAVLNPSPFTHNEQQDLNAAKIQQLELMLELAKNVNNIRELSIALNKAKTNVDQLSKFFGV